MSYNPIDPNNAQFDPNAVNGGSNSMNFDPNNLKGSAIPAHGHSKVSFVDEYAMIMIQALSRAQRGISIQQGIDTQTTQNAAMLLNAMNNYWYGPQGVLQYWAEQVAHTSGDAQTTAQSKYNQASANANVSTGQMQSTMSQGETVAGNDTTNLANIGQVVQAMMSLFSFIASKM